MEGISGDYIGWIIGIASIAAGVILYLWSQRSKQKSEKRGLYKVVLKKSFDLQPAEVMGELRGSHKGGFRDYCLDRDEIDQIKKRIAAGKDVLVIGDPLAGKTRAVYEALKHAENKTAVTIPRIVDVNPNEFKVPQHLSGTRKGVLLVDDINKYVSKQHFEHLLQQYIDNGYLIIATCRKGPELDRAKSALEQIFASLFDDPVEMGKVDREEAEAVAQKTDVDMPTSYDGNIGSIFVPIEAMRQRYAEDCTDEGRAVLRSIKRLFMGGVYEEGGIYSEGHIKKVCEELEELKLEKFKWRELLDSLASLSFLQPGKEGFAVEETYIEQIFKVDCSLLDNFRELAALFSDDPEALFKVGNRADNKQYTEDLGDDYVKVKRLAVDTFQAVLSHWSLKTHTERHAMTQNSLGIAYGKLADIEDKAANCQKAIAAYQEALKVYTLERFPMDYAMTQNNLGVAYDTLAEVEDKAANCQKAIAAYQEALNVYTLERFPIQYAMTQNNLGAAYQSLGDIKDKAANGKKAIAAYQEALKVYRPEQFPMQYAAIQNNLGNAYRNLGDIEEKAANCKKAIAAYEEALKVRTLERFPMDYAMTQNNLGVAYRNLGDIEDKAANCKKAIAAYQEVLKVYTQERFPMNYANTKNNLGVAYWGLGDIADKAANCKRARKAYEAALSVYRKLDMPLQVELVERNLAILDAFEAEE